jgi:hypothetical protein
VIHQYTEPGAAEQGRGLGDARFESNDNFLGHPLSLTDTASIFVAAV